MLLDHLWNPLFIHHQKNPKFLRIDAAGVRAEPSWVAFWAGLIVWIRERLVLSMNRWVAPIAKMITGKPQLLEVHLECKATSGSQGPSFSYTPQFSATEVSSLSWQAGIFWGMTCSLFGWSPKTLHSQSASIWRSTSADEGLLNLLIPNI